MDPWEALAVDDEVLKEFLEPWNSDTPIILRPTGNAKVVLLKRQLYESDNMQGFMNKMAVASHAQDFIQMVGSGRKCS